ncbi:hypothetical protein [Nonomuraea sp. NPDC049695]|uniref:hypothetical protein n=1 Tax=Nonomuraea sp. NPDC049695 TaxID=3154734 RepID=UPI00344A9120
MTSEQAKTAVGGSGSEAVSLGRSGDVVVRESWLGAHVKDDPWAGEGRFAEYRDTGPGAAVTPDRPQLSDEQAREHTVRAYLGSWVPFHGR